MQSRHFENIDSEGVKLMTLLDGERRLVILLHGFPQCWYLWRNQIDAIAESGYQVAVPDQRGYGESDAPEDITDYDILHLTSDVKNIAEKLGHQRFTVIGHDWGAVEEVILHQRQKRLVCKVVFREIAVALKSLMGVARIELALAEL